MALFKIYRGTEEEFKLVPLHEGYAYFVEDTGDFYIDIGSNQGDRVQVNAYAAQILKKDDTEIDIDDIFLQSMIAEVKQGGTGRETLTVNALLIGNGTDPVKMVSIDAGSVLLGDSTNGVAGLKGTGVLYATTAGAPSFGIAPVTAGGTGASTAAAARTNLDVYSKADTDTKIKEVTTVAYTATLLASGWVQNGESYTYSYSNTDITNGKNGDVPLIITYTSNLDEYSKIDTAESTPGQGIIFTTAEKPENDIGLIIIDVK